MDIPKNKVILIGGNHHNGLGLVRCFGINKIFPYGIIVGHDAAHGFLQKSKYWAKTWTIQNDTDIPEFLLHHFPDEAERPVVIPYSDAAAEIIDLNYNRLKDHFILPSIGEKQGNIAVLMDKQEQYKFATAHDIPMAKSCVVELNHIILPDDMVYPCIVKPVVSAEGIKSDIRKCDTKEETLKYLLELQKKGYHRFLVQEYLDFETEYVMIGMIYAPECAWLNLKKLRIWPLVGGSSSLLQLTANSQIESFYEKVRTAFDSVGYDGLFDVDALYANGKMYLNEINWRNSGVIYSVLGTSVYYPVAWYYLKAIGKLPQNYVCTCKDQSIHAMDEALDLRHVVCHNITLKQWFHSKKMCRSFALWYTPDLKPTIAQYFHLAKELIKRHGVQS